MGRTGRAAWSDPRAHPAARATASCGLTASDRSPADRARSAFRELEEEVQHLSDTIRMLEERLQGRGGANNPPPPRARVPLRLRLRPPAVREPDRAPRPRPTSESTGANARHERGRSPFSGTSGAPAHTHQVRNRTLSPYAVRRTVEPHSYRPLPSCVFPPPFASCSRCFSQRGSHGAGAR